MVDLIHRNAGWLIGVLVAVIIDAVLRIAFDVNHLGVGILLGAVCSIVGLTWDHARIHR